MRKCSSSHCKVVVAAASSEKASTANMILQNQLFPASSSHRSRWVRKRSKVRRRRVLMAWFQLRNCSNNKVCRIRRHQRSQEMMINRWMILGNLPIKIIAIIWWRYNSMSLQLNKLIKLPNWCGSRKRRWTLTLMMIRWPRTTNWLRKSNSFRKSKTWLTWKMNRSKVVTIWHQCNNCNIWMH